MSAILGKVIQREGTKKRYHFRCGTNHQSAIGFEASVLATSKVEALDTLYCSLPFEISVAPVNKDERVRFITVIVRPDTITVKHIDEVEEL